MYQQPPPPPPNNNKNNNVPVYQTYYPQHSPWSRLVIRSEQNGQMEGYRPPREDINSPDLYIPAMAFVTYVLLTGIVAGTKHKFHPEVLGINATTGLLLVILELLFIKIGCYLLNITSETQFLDFLSYSGYKFIGSLRYVVFPDSTNTVQVPQRKRRIHFLFVVSALQNVKKEEKSKTISSSPSEMSGTETELSVGEFVQTAKVVLPTKVKKANQAINKWDIKTLINFLQGRDLKLNDKRFKIIDKEQTVGVIKVWNKLDSAFKPPDNDKELQRCINPEWEHRSNNEAFKDMGDEETGLYQTNKRKRKVNEAFDEEL
nr:7524_t:CDS:10 [Entrophospora candida]